jgi:RNA polymerase sigma factor (sigma-70 family)
MLGDEARLYEALAVDLERIVRAEVRAPREVIEDACHHAWAQLINHSERVERDKALTWLARTAIRHAWKLNRREQRELSLEATANTRVVLPIVSQSPGPPEHVEARERLATVDELPERQRRLIWLRAVGLSYVEMAAFTGDSQRTVERQLLRATSRMRQLDHERQQLERDTTLPLHVALAPDPTARRTDHEQLGLER